MKRLFMDIHILQTVPPSCINRDDTGSPKTAVYGGVTRARVSSQAWKKAMRDMFRNAIAGETFEMGIRTKALLELVTEKIMNIQPGVEEKRASKFAMDTINLAGEKKIIKSKNNDNKKEDDSEEAEQSGNEALFLITPKQIESVARLALRWINGDKKPTKSEVIDALNINKGIDEALFGRMVAQAPSLNTEACAQVAHSISTHKVITEYDFYTAVDDIENEDHAGAAFLDTNEFYSATFYRYSTVAIHELQEYLQGKTPEAVRMFLDAFALSMPTGKQNSYANNNPPFLVFVTFREDRPVNMSGAFEKAVSAGKDGSEGYEQASIYALERYVEEIHDKWVGKPASMFYCGRGTNTFGESLSFSELRNKVYKLVNEYVSGGGLS